MSAVLLLWVGKLPLTARRRSRLPSTGVASNNAIASGTAAASRAAAAAPRPIDEPREVDVCEPGIVRTRTAWSRANVSAVTARRACAHATGGDDLLVGVWHSRATEHRLRWIVESWYRRGAVVFLAQRNDSAPPPQPQQPQSPSSQQPRPATPLPEGSVLATNCPADDYLGTLEKGLLGLKVGWGK